MSDSSSPLRCIVPCPYIGLFLNSATASVSESGFILPNAVCAFFPCEVMSMPATNQCMTLHRASSAEHFAVAPIFRKHMALFEDESPCRPQTPLHPTITSLRSFTGAMRKGVLGSSGGQGTPSRVPLAFSEIPTASSSHRPNAHTPRPASHSKGGKWVGWDRMRAVRDE